MRTALTPFLVVPTLMLLFMSAYSDSLPSASRARADATNLKRAQIGLRQIGTEWECIRSSRGRDEWLRHPASESADKVVQYEKGALAWEEDSYFSGRSVFMDSQTVQEQLVIRYDYTAKQAEIHYIGNDPAVTSLIDGVSGRDVASTLSTADKILGGWGVSRK